jgi:2-polyprenyl-3-methyl-5-hydroxy-6-metoxy-1,4-benzoquinol methylase
MPKFNYENDQYLQKLDDLPEAYYSKYISYVKKYLNRKDDAFLDIGCGNGKIISLLKEQGFRNGYGVDISKLFIKEAKNRGIKNAYYYDGINFPFKENYFNVVGSFNVLEHVESPDEFIKSQVRILKRNGYIIIACPNFLSVLFKNNHRRLKGFKNKRRNLGLILLKKLNLNKGFEMMEPVKKKKFEYDDDAIVVTNIIDIKRTLENNNCRIIYMSGFINFDSGLYRAINSIPFMKYMLPSCFVVAKKK